jgi:hypothetical protein
MSAARPPLRSTSTSCCTATIVRRPTGAGRAQVGDMFQISRAHPRSGFPIHASRAHYLLIGDET